MITTYAQEVRLDLIPPTEIKGYAEGIQVGDGDLISLVVLITNYVLGFLGLLAISAIIYAGILYVANFGNDELTGKAKSIIIYVSIGIVVILLSFAIVNTLLGVVGGGGNRFGSGGSPGRIGVSDNPVTTIDSLFDVEGKDFVYPLLTTLRELGDLCPDTPIGLGVNNSGCALNELVPDTDSDGVANILDTDDDNDGVVDENDADVDGDGVCDGTASDPSCSSGPDLCPDTLSFVTFKVSGIERKKLQIDRTSKKEYLKSIKANKGCAEYQTLNDIDGDGEMDKNDCDADADGLIDNKDCADVFFERFPPGNPDNVNISPDTTFRGVVVFDVFRDEIDTDDDNDGIVDFGAGLRSDATELLLRQLANNFNQLESFIRITCATLPQTQKVLDYCGYNSQGEAFGKLVRFLSNLSSDLSFIDFDSFDAVYQEFLSVAKSFSRVQVKIDSSQFEGFLPADNSPLSVSFDASGTVDPYQEFCPVDDQKYYWFVNKTLDFSQGLPGILSSSTNPPDGTGVFFDYDFAKAGIFNVQLLVRSACRYNIVNPGAGESDDVDAAIAGLANARVRVFPPRAKLNVRINGADDNGNKPVKILTGTQTPISFDLTGSTTSRGSFASLNYDCGNGVTNTIQGSQANWTFSCTYTDATGSKIVRLQARDTVGDVQRVVSLQFSDVIAFLRVSPGLQGMTNTAFTFDGTQSNASSTISNYTYVIDQKQGASYQEIARSQTSSVYTYTFTSPGEYRVTLNVSTGGGLNQLSSDVVKIIINEQNPIASFKISYPETIRPARALFDGSLSFHPDFSGQNVLTYLWEVDGVALQPSSSSSTGPFSYEQVTSGSDAQVYFEFKSVGKHQVRLTVVRGGAKDTVVESTDVKTLLGVSFSTDKPAARINEVITFTPQSDKALGYFWDFGDGESLVGDDQSVVHIYKRQGEYMVRLTVEDASGNTNELQKKVRVGLQNTPVSFVQVFVNNVEQDLSQSTCLKITRADSVLFDSSRSINVKGDGSGISYLWEIADFDEVIRTRTFTRIFKNLTRGSCIDIDFSVTDLSTQAIDKADTISIEVVNIPPTVTDIRYVVTEPDLVTPVSVTVSVLGARDVDGRIARYRWWYFEEGQGQRHLDSRVTDIPRTTFVVGPSNVEGTETTYYFAVEIEDNDGGVTSSLDEVGPSEPLVVTNGPNVAPVAEFVTDRSTVSVDELITFTSTTVDPLGEFIPSAGYQWDFEGDGEYERGISGSKVTYRYKKPGVYVPTLKVSKNGLMSQYEMKIRVLPSTKAPQAAFIFVQSGARVKFISNSTVDKELDDKSLKYSWDFDTSIDTDGNGVFDDDADSSLLAPVYEFEGDRDVMVALKVTDSVGNFDTVVRKIPFIKRDEKRGPLGSRKQVGFRAVLNTNPPRNQLDSKVYVRPPFGDVIFNSKKSLGNIQEYRIDTNIFVDSDGDGIADNDIDNKTHSSWKDGSSFKRTYRESEGRIRARLMVVDLNGKERSQVVDIVFADEEPILDLNTLQNPDDILQLLETIPVVRFDVSTSFAQPDDVISFDASATSFPDEDVAEYRWDFDGDGLVDEISFDPVFPHSFQETGVYEVILEAVSDGGLQGEYSQTIFIRGGLTLPSAVFTYQLDGNQVHFTNVSTYDDSFSDEDIRYQWDFVKLDLSVAKEWETLKSEETLSISERVFDQPAIWVRNTLGLEDVDSGAGVIAPEIILGNDSLKVRFTEGTTFVDSLAKPYVGNLQLSTVSSSDLNIENQNIVGVFNTGISDVLKSSESVQFLYDGVISDARLYRLISTDADPELVSEGNVQDNLTLFSSNDFGGKYIVVGNPEESSGASEVSLGKMTLKEPIKVFPEAGLYKITLSMIDGVGEKSSTSEFITVDKDLSVVVSTAVEPEEISSEDVNTVVPDKSTDLVDVPDSTENVQVSGKSGGFSIFWLIFFILLLGGGGGVAFVVIRTMRQRHKELDLQKTDEPSSEASSQIVEPEIIQTPRSAPASDEKPISGKKDVSTSSSASDTDSSDKGQSSPVEEEKNESKEDKGSDDHDDKNDSSGPIPDWLKG